MPQRNGRFEDDSSFFWRDEKMKYETLIGR